MSSAWFPMTTSLKELVQGRGAYRVADVMGFGGGFALGAVQAGFQLAAKREDAGAMGVSVVQANRAVLGAKWSIQAVAPDKWRLVTADVVVGTPAPEQADTVVRYAAKLRPAVVVLDLAPDAVAQGELASALGEQLNRLTKLTYRVARLRYNDLSLGGALDRPRCFVVFSQIPVGFGHMVLDWLPAADDVVNDLWDLEASWETQRLVRRPTWYSRALRTPEHTVDGLMTALDYRSAREWAWTRPGTPLSPEGLFPVRGRDRHLITHREIARLMGFPDAWLLGTAPRGLQGRFLGAYWDVSTSVAPARWVMQWVRRALDGAPGPLRGDLDLSEDWHALAIRQWGSAGNR